MLAGPCGTVLSVRSPGSPVASRLSRRYRNFLTSKHRVRPSPESRSRMPVRLSAGHQAPPWMPARPSGWLPLLHAVSACRSTPAANHRLPRGRRIRRRRPPPVRQQPRLRPATSFVPRRRDRPAQPRLPAGQSDSRTPRRRQHLPGERRHNAGKPTGQRGRVPPPHSRRRMRNQRQALCRTAYSSSRCPCAEARGPEYQAIHGRPLRWACPVLVNGPVSFLSKPAGRV